MANLSITAASVLPTTTTEEYGVGLAGETVTAGMAVYLKSSDGRYWKAQADGTAAEAAAVGIAMNNAAAGQALKVSRGRITIGATVAVGSIYCVSTAAGSIWLSSDLGSSNYVTILGVADSVTTITVRPSATGIVKA